MSKGKSKLLIVLLAICLLFATAAVVMSIYNCATQPGEQAGLPGEPGEPGEKGDRGTLWFKGEGNPNNAGVLSEEIAGTVLKGDYFLNTVTEDVYSYNGKTWEFVVTLRGERGSSWAMGVGDPAASPNDQVGDFYLDGKTGEVWQYKEGIGWDDVFNIKGEKGEKGESGTTWYNNAGQPLSALGSVGDYYIDNTTYDVYEKKPADTDHTAPWWNKIGNLRGGQGEQGDVGSQIFYGTKAPAEATEITAREGDLYLYKNEDGDLSLYRYNGSAWDPLGELNGKDGDTVVGSKWLFGNGNPKENEFKEQGQIGDFYLDVTSSDIYNKKESGWEFILNIKGESNRWFSGEGAPTDEGIAATLGDANIGDYYLDTKLGDIYKKETSGWVKTGANIKGPQGESGTPIQPAQWHFGQKPTASDGANGDFWLDNEFNLYVKANCAWENKGNLKGVAGAAGPAGPAGPAGSVGPAGSDGKDGSMIYYGDDAPASHEFNGAELKVGDLYIQKNDSLDLYYYTGSDSAWLQLGSLKGEKGEDGQGSQGIPGDDGQDGTQIYFGNGQPGVGGTIAGGTELHKGDLYLDKDTYKLYNYNGTGWDELGTLQGTRGSKWFNGTKDVAKETDDTIRDPLAGDYYLNTENGNIYIYDGGAWTQTGNITGPKGLDGNPGINGKTWYYGEGEASALAPGAVEGDFFLNTSNFNVYVKQADGSWALQGNIRGEAGRTWLNGETAPKGEEGAIGDLYLDTVTGQVYLKSAESTWTPLFKIKGQDGTNGATWHMNEGKPAAGLGKEGDFCIDKTTGDIYQKGAEDWGNSIGNLKGQRGSMIFSGEADPSGDISVALGDYTAQEGDLYLYKNGEVVDLYRYNGTWQLVGTLTGEKGDKGDRSSMTFTGEQDPNGGGFNLGVELQEGDLYIYQNKAENKTILYRYDTHNQWVKIGDLTGATGATGAAGANTYFGENDPATHNFGGAELHLGDLYFWTNTEENGITIHRYTGAEWTRIGKIANGAAGNNGTNGKTWYFGTEQPGSHTFAPAEPVEGDFYLKTDDFHVFVKKADNWDDLGTLQGAKGDKGTVWYYGEGGPNSNPALGFTPNDRDYYLDKNTNNVWSYNAGEQTWEMVTNISGTRGSTWFYGTTEFAEGKIDDPQFADPSVKLLPGDFYLNGTDLMLYRYNGTEWEEVGSLKGETGEQGERGAMWFSFAGAPNEGTFASQVKEGDYYLDTATGDIYKRDSSAPKGWKPTGWNIKGPQGEKGSIWYNGEGAPETHDADTLAEARVGDYYLDSATGNVYEKVASCEIGDHLNNMEPHWHNIGNIRGPEGEQGRNPWAMGTGEPSNDKAQIESNDWREGDLYVDLQTGYLYQLKNDGGNLKWEKFFSMKGDRGSKWFTSGGIESKEPWNYTWGDTEVLKGDYYLDTVTGEIYEFIGEEENSQDAWQSVGNIKGATGRAARWFTGSGAPGTIEGSASGDMYLDTLTGDIYQKDGEAWGTPIDNIMGPRGAMWFSGEGKPEDNETNEGVWGGKFDDNVKVGDIYCDSTTGDIYQYRRNTDTLGTTTYAWEKFATIEGQRSTRWYYGYDNPVEYPNTPAVEGAAIGDFYFQTFYSFSGWTGYIIWVREEVEGVPTWVELVNLSAKAEVPSSFAIKNIYELRAFRDAVNSGKDYKGLTAYVVADITIPAGETWEPIGTEAHPFKGNFIGGVATNESAGTFEMSKEPRTISGVQNGTLFGYADGSTIENINVRGSIAPEQAQQFLMDVMADPTKALVSNHQGDELTLTPVEIVYDLNGATLTVTCDAEGNISFYLKGAEAATIALGADKYTATFSDVQFTLAEGVAYTFDTIKFTGNSYIVATGAKSLTVTNCYVETDAQKVEGYSRAGFILGKGSEKIDLTVTDNTFLTAGATVDGYSTAIFMWTPINTATISGNTFGSVTAPYAYTAVKFLGFAEGATLTYTGNTVYGTNAGANNDTETGWEFEAFNLCQTNGSTAYTAIFENNTVNVANDETNTEEQPMYIVFVEGNGGAQVYFKGTGNTLNGSSTLYGAVGTEPKEADKAYNFIVFDAELTAENKLTAGDVYLGTNFGAEHAFTPTNLAEKVETGKEHDVRIIDIAFADPTGFVQHVADYDTYYYVNNENGLGYFRDMVNAMNAYEGNPQEFENKTIVTTQDIDLEGIDWVPISGTGCESLTTNKYYNYKTSFKGTFTTKYDREEPYAIKNLMIDRSTAPDAGKDMFDVNNTDGKFMNLGLFGYIYKATLKDIKLTNVTIKTDKSGNMDASTYGIHSSVGALVGYVNGGTYENITVDGLIDIESVNYVQIGGVIGWIEGANLTNITVDAEAGSKISSASSSSVQGVFVGGILGHQDGGGEYKDLTVKNITISGNRNVGGLIGVTTGTIDGATLDKVTIQSIATGIDSSESGKNIYAKNIGAVVGAMGASGASINISNVNATGLTFQRLENTNREYITKAVWNNGYVGGIYNTAVTDSSTAFAKIVIGEKCHLDAQLDEGLYIVDGVYEIRNADGLQRFVDMVTKNIYVFTHMDVRPDTTDMQVKLLVDVNVETDLKQDGAWKQSEGGYEYALYSIGSDDYIPRGYETLLTVNTFKGTFDGGIYGADGTLEGTHKITGLTTALFGTTNSATIQNLTLEGVNIESTGTGSDSLGALINEANETLIENISVSGSVVGNGHMAVGGIVGLSATKLNPHALIKNVSFEGTVQGQGTMSMVGGIAGIATVSIEGATVKGTITGIDAYSAGGIYGGAMEIKSGTTSVDETVHIKSVTVEGSVTGASFVGGVVGGVHTADFYDVMVKADITKTYKEGDNTQYARAIGVVTGSTVRQVKLGAVYFNGTIDNQAAEGDTDHLNYIVYNYGLVGSALTGAATDSWASGKNVNPAANVTVEAADATGDNATLGGKRFTAVVNAYIEATDLDLSARFLAAGGANAMITVKSAQGLANVAELVNGGITFEGEIIMLGTDITLGGAYQQESAITIGKEDAPFKGTFSGGYDYTHTIANQYGSLFGYTEGATIQNLVLDEQSIQSAAMLVKSGSATISNVTINGFTTEVDGNYPVDPGTVAKAPFGITGSEEGFTYNTVDITLTFGGITFTAGYGEENIVKPVTYIGTGADKSTFNNVSFELEANTYTFENIAFENTEGYVFGGNGAKIYVKNSTITCTGDAQIFNFTEGTYDSTAYLLADEQTTFSVNGESDVKAIFKGLAARNFALVGYEVEFADADGEEKITAGHFIYGAKAKEEAEKEIGGEFDAALKALVQSKECYGNVWVENGDGSHYNLLFNYKTLIITTVAELEAFRSAVNNGETFKDREVALWREGEQFDAEKGTLVEGAENNIFDLDEIENWQPIGTSSTAFQGTFDGRGYTIKNLKTEQTDHAGLFGYTSDATIKNLKVENATVKTTVPGKENSAGYAGVVVARFFGGTIQNIEVTGKIEVTSAGRYAGGVVAWAYGNITNAHVNATDPDSFVYAQMFTAGGILGFIGEGGYTINDVSSNIHVKAPDAAGGILGNTAGESEVTIKNATATGTIEKTKENYEPYTKALGGIVGVSAGMSVTIKNSTFTGTFIVNDEKVFGNLYNHGIIGYEEKNYTLNATDSHVTLTVAPGFAAKADWNETGVVDAYFGVESVVGLKFFRDVVNGDAEGYKAYDFAKDVPVRLISTEENNGIFDLGGDPNSGANAWTPIGTESNKFRGTFDGQNNTIKNLYVNLGDKSYGGLFGLATDNAHLQNLNIDTANINGDAYLGALAGQVYTGGIDNVNVTDVTVNGHHYVGGVYGHGYAYVHDCSVKDAEIHATPKQITDGKYDDGDKVGGIVGWNNDSAGADKIVGNTVENVVLSGYRDIGGIVGYSKNAEIKNNTVKGVKIIVDQTTYDAGDKETNAGFIVGRADTGNGDDADLAYAMTLNAGNTIEEGYDYSLTYNIKGNTALQSALDEATEYGPTTINLAAGTYTGTSTVDINNKAFTGFTILGNVRTATKPTDGSYNENKTYTRTINGLTIKPISGKVEFKSSLVMFDTVESNDGLNYLTCLNVDGLTVEGITFENVDYPIYFYSVNGSSRWNDLKFSKNNISWTNPATKVDDKFIPIAIYSENGAVADGEHEWFNTNVTIDSNVFTNADRTTYLHDLSGLKFTNNTVNGYYFYAVAFQGEAIGGDVVVSGNTFYDPDDKTEPNEGLMRGTHLYGDLTIENNKFYGITANKDTDSNNEQILISLEEGVHGHITTSGNVWVAANTPEDAANASKYAIVELDADIETKTKYEYHLELAISTLENTTVNGNTVAGLTTYRDDVNDPEKSKYFTPALPVRLTGPIDLETEASWTPIGTETNPFHGTFDGNGYTISNLTINTPEANNVGLFGVIGGYSDHTKSAGYVKNLTIENVDLKGAVNVGSAVANIARGEVSDITVTGNIHLEGQKFVGGVIGYNYGAFNNLTVIKTAPAAAAIALGDGSFKNQSFDIIATGLDASESAGGAVGASFYEGTASNLTVKNISVYAAKAAGGVVGNIGPNAIFDQVLVDNVKAAADENTAGMILGTTQSGDKLTNYECLNSSVWKWGGSDGIWDSELDASVVAPQDWSGNKVTPGEVASSEDRINSAWLTDKLAISTTDTGLAKIYKGNSDSALAIRYEVSSAQGLVTLSNAWNAGLITADKFEKGEIVIKLVGDINMAEAEGFAPIGTSDHPFTGTFDGNGYTITDLTIETQTAERYKAGLFGSLKGATVENLIIEGANISAPKAEFVGVLASGAVDSTISHITIRNAQVTGGTWVGGVVGHISGNTTVTECTVTGGELKVQNYKLGGVVGFIAGDHQNASVSNNTVDSVKLTALKQSEANADDGYGMIGGIAGGTDKSSDATVSNNTLNNVTIDVSAIGIDGTTPGKEGAQVQTNFRIYEKYTGALVANGGAATYMDNTGNVTVTAPDAHPTNSGLSGPCGTEEGQIPTFANNDITVTWNGLRAKDDGYAVANKAELETFRGFVNEGTRDFAGETVYLEDDIALGGGNWTPIGTSAHHFMGTFDGGNHIISGINVTGSKYLGLFGFVGENKVPVQEAAIKNLTIDGVNTVIVSGTTYNDRNDSGLIAGYAANVAFSNITIAESASVTITGVSGSGYTGNAVGGLVGASQSCTYDNITTNSIIRVDDKGGIMVGGIIGLSMHDALTTVEVSNVWVDGTFAVGGLIGTAFGTETLEYVQVGGNVYMNFWWYYLDTNASDYYAMVGGLVGTAELDKAEDTLTISNSSFNGSITRVNAYVIGDDPTLHLYELPELPNFGLVGSNRIGTTGSDVNISETSVVVDSGSAQITGNLYGDDYTLTGKYGATDEFTIDSLSISSAVGLTYYVSLVKSGYSVAEVTTDFDVQIDNIDKSGRVREVSISSAEGLAFIHDNYGADEVFSAAGEGLSFTINLLDDIDMKELAVDGKEYEWSAMSGHWVTINGNGNAIKNLNAVPNGNGQTGLFGYAGGCKINELTIEGFTGYGSQVGVFAGNGTEGATLVDCHIKGEIKITYENRTWGESYTETVGGVGAAFGVTTGATQQGVTIDEDCVVNLTAENVVTTWAPKDYVLGYMPASCTASYTENNGTIIVNGYTVYTIADEAELIAFRDEVNGGNDYANMMVLLTDDITLGGGNWSPIGTDANRFMGIFDGGYHTISNITVRGTKYLGLFGFIGNVDIPSITPAIRNLTIGGENMIVVNDKDSASRNDSGVLAGYAARTTFSNITVTGSVTIAAYFGNPSEQFLYGCTVGGLVGASQTNTYNNIAFTPSQAFVSANAGYTVGGVIGLSMKDTINGMDVNNVSVYGAAAVGGVIGTNYRGLTMSDVRVTNTTVNLTMIVVWGGEYDDEYTVVGGLVGAAYNGTVTIESSSFQGWIETNLSDDKIVNYGLVGGTAFFYEGAQAVTLKITDTSVDVLVGTYLEHDDFALKGEYNEGGTFDISSFTGYTETGESYRQKIGYNA